MHRPAASSPWSTFALVAGAMVVGTLNYSIVFVAFPELQRSFDAPASSVSWAMTAFSITVAALTVPCGWLADRIGRKRQFLIGVAVFALGSALVATAPTLGLLIAARVVQAAGLAAEGPAAQAIVLTAFPLERRSSAVGAIGALGGIFSAIGPVVGGALIDSVGWRWTFAASIPISLLTIGLGARMLPATAPGRDAGNRGRPDLVGVTLLVGGVTALAFGIVQADDWGWADPRISVSLLGAAVLLPSLIRRCRLHPDPILDLSLWRERRFRIGSMLGFVVAGHFGAMFLTSIVLMTDVWGLSRFRGGLAVAIIPAIAGPLTFAAGRWADRHGHRRVIVPGAAFFVLAGLFLLIRVGDERRLLAVWVPGAVLYAVGVGLAHAATQSAAMSAVPVARLGIGGAMTRIFTDVGNTLWVAIAIAVVASAPDTVTGVRRVFSTMIVVGVVGGLLAARLTPTALRCTSQPHTGSSEVPPG